MSGSAGIPFVLWFHQCGRERIEEVGGKVANLGALLRRGVPVPPGFAITDAAFQLFLEQSGVGREIRSLLEAIDDEDISAATRVSNAIRSLVVATPVPPPIRDEVAAAYVRLCRECAEVRVPVAVRSSAASEDALSATFAGQQESLLGVRGVEQVVPATVRCWSSLFTARAMIYRRRLGIPYERLRIGVGVQRMVDARVGGVAFTLDPTNGDRSTIAIEANWGLGAGVAGGEQTPDRFLVDKVTFSIISRVVSPKSFELVMDASTGRVDRRSVPSERLGVSCLSEEEVVALSRLARSIERHSGALPQDIEWALARGQALPDNLTVLQSRPETVWARRPRCAVLPSLPSTLDYVIALITPGPADDQSTPAPSQPAAAGPVVWLLRHGEVLGHEADFELTPRGRQQALRAAQEIAEQLSVGGRVLIRYSPVSRSRQTAEVIAACLAGRRSQAAGSAADFALSDPEPDPALLNGRFLFAEGDPPLEPSRAFEATTNGAALRAMPAVQADFCRGFWSSPDPMGYWLTHDAAGGIESPELVLRRVGARIEQIFSDPLPGRAIADHHILVTHSGTLRVLLREAFGVDPGEPEFCEVVRLSGHRLPGWVTVWYRGRSAELDPGDFRDS